MQHLIPRGDWQFGKMENGQVVFNPDWITVKGGFKAGMTYQLTYESKDPPVGGPRVRGDSRSGFCDQE